MKIRAAAVSHKNSCTHLAEGLNISTAGVMEGNCVPDAVCNVMEQNGYSISRKKPSGDRSIWHIGHGTMLLPCVKKLRKS